MATDWQMPKRSNRCAVTDREFAIGEVICVSLFETEEGFQRLDTCTDVDWPDGDGLIARWRTRRPEPASKAQGPMDREGLIRLLEQLQNAASERQIALRFALALLLWRKKAVTLVESRTAEDDDHGEIWVFQRTKADDRYEVRRPELTEEEVADLSDQLEEMLADASSAVAVATGESAEGAPSETS